VPPVPSKHDNADEMIHVVDRHDVVVGTMTKDDAYNARHRVRIVCVYLMNPETGDIAVTRRGATVSWQPLHHSMSACGHVGAGESWDAAAAREMFEEIGVSTPLRHVAKEAFDDTTGRHFVLATYVGHATPAQIVSSAREVAELRWISPRALRALLDAGDALHNVFPPSAEKLLAAL